MIMYSCFLKRLIDFVIVFFVLAVIWPILLFMAVWLHFANKGAGAFFTQERPGKHGKIFKGNGLVQTVPSEQGYNNVLLRRKGSLCDAFPYRQAFLRLYRNKPAPSDRPFKIQLPHA